MAVLRADGGRPFRARRRPGYDPPYRTWGYPVVPVVFIVASLAIVANQVYRQPVEAAVGLGLVAAGLPFTICPMRVVDFHNHYYPPEYMSMR